VPGPRATSPFPVEAAVTVDTKGQQQKKAAFYIRIGNGTREITDPTERQKFTASRWGQVPRRLHRRDGQRIGGGAAMTQAWVIRGGRHGEREAVCHPDSKAMPPCRAGASSMDSSDARHWHLSRSDSMTLGDLSWPDLLSGEPD